MNTHHVLFDCSTWLEERRKMSREYEEAGGGMPRTVKQFLDLRKVTVAVLGFIAATLMGQRTQ